MQCTVENLQSFKRGVCFGLLVLCIWLIQKGIVMTITNKDSEAMTTMGKLRSSCFLMGIIFLVFSVVLKVG